MNNYNPFVYQKVNDTDIKSPNIPSNLPEQYAQCGEDLAILAIAIALQQQGLLATWDGYINVEIGANHAFGGSNSFLLEERLGIPSLLVEANYDLIEDLRTARPRSQVINMAICNDDRQFVTLFCSNHNELSSLNHNFVDDWHGGRVGVAKTIEVPAMRMNRFIEQHVPASKQVLLLSIDIEGQDLSVIEDTDFTRFRPALVMMEPSEHFRPGESSRMINAMHANGYSLIGKTDVNLIFVDANLLSRSANLAQTPIELSSRAPGVAAVATPAPAQPIADDALQLGLATTQAFPTWQLDEELINRALELIGSDGALSLDIFDTALTRRLASPPDVFAELERRLQVVYGNTVRGLAAAREQAEMVARRRHHELHNNEEILFQEIYRELPALLPAFGDWELASATELQIEREVLVAVPDILELTRRLQAAGKPYIFVSDMYLPRDFLASVLQQAGYAGWADIFVSSEHRATKASGRIWDVVGQSYPLAKLVHIGDNAHSDVTVPKQYGVSTLAYRRVLSEPRLGVQLNAEVPAYSLWQRHVELTAAQTLAPSDERALWHQLGRSLGGIVLSTFVSWLAQRVRTHGIQRLYFCARDGYLMQQAWVASGLAAELGVEHRYLYISRASLNLANAARESTPQNLSHATVDFLASSIGSTSVRAALQRADLLRIDSLTSDALAAFGSLDAMLATAEDIQRFAALLRGHSAAIHAVLQEKYVACEHYLRQEGLADGKRHGVVDMGWHGSLQRSLTGMCASFAPGFNAPLGFYYGLWPAVARNRYLAGPMEACFASSFRRAEDQSPLHQGVALLEELHSAAHGTTLGYNVEAGVAKPLLQATSPAQAANDLHVGWFQQGALEGIRQLHGQGGEAAAPVRAADLSIDSALAALGAVFLSPSAVELDLLARIGHCATFDHSVLDPLVTAAEPPTSDAMRHALYRSEWAAGQMRLWQLHGSDACKTMLQPLAPAIFPHFGKRALRQFA